MNGKTYNDSINREAESHFYRAKEMDDKWVIDHRENIHFLQKIESITRYVDKQPTCTTYQLDFINTMRRKQKLFRYTF